MEIVDLRRWRGGIVKEQVYESLNLYRKYGNLGRGMNLEALLEPCRLLLFGDSLNISKEAINANFDIS